MLNSVLDTPFSFKRRDAFKLTLKVFIATLGIAFVTGIFTGVTKIVLGHMPPWLELQHPGVVAVLDIGTFALVGAYALKKAHISWSEFLTLRSAPVLSFALLLPVTVGLAVIVSEMDNIINVVVPAPTWIIEYMRKLCSLAEHPFAAPFAVVITAPLTEELFFRGLILRRLLTSYSAWPAIWTSALLFMAFHVNPWQLPCALLAGLLLGWVYARTRSLLLCIAGHAYYNAAVLYCPHLPFAIQGFNTEPTPGVNVFQPWWLNLAGVVVLGLGLYCLARVMPPLPTPRRPSEPPVLKHSLA